MAGFAAPRKKCCDHIKISVDYFSKDYLISEGTWPRPDQGKRRILLDCGDW
jgi:hypothetical protein